MGKTNRHRRNPNLAPCPDCGAKISQTAESCPRCGRSFKILATDYYLGPLIGVAGALSIPLILASIFFLCMGYGSTGIESDMFLAAGYACVGLLCLIVAYKVFSLFR